MLQFAQMFEVQAHFLFNRVLTIGLIDYLYFNQASM